MFFGLHIFVTASTFLGSGLRPVFAQNMTSLSAFYLTFFNVQLKIAAYCSTEYLVEDSVMLFF